MHLVPDIPPLDLDADLRADAVQFSDALTRGLSSADGAGSLLRDVHAVVDDLGAAIRTALGVPGVATLDQGGNLRVRFDAANVATIAEVQLAPSVFPLDVICERRSQRCTNLAFFKNALIEALENPAVAARIRNAAKRNGPALKVAPKSFTGVLTSGGVTA